MTIRPLAVTVYLLLISSCSAQEGTQPTATKAIARGEPKAETKGEPLERALERKGGKEPSVLDVWNNIVREGEQKSGAIKNLGKPRAAPKGAKPEITINFDGMITFDGKPLRLGDSIDKWQAVLPRNAVCRVNEATRCYWDQLGLKVMTSERQGKDVIQIDIHINLEKVESWELPVKSAYKTKPDESFKGYLEIDGYGIDKDTRFWEMRAGVDARRALYCGILDCSHPKGGGGGGQTYVAVRVDGRSEYDKLRIITMAGAAQ